MDHRRYRDIRDWLASLSPYGHEYIAPVSSYQYPERLYIALEYMDTEIARRISKEMDLSKYPYDLRYAIAKDALPATSDYDALAALGTPDDLAHIPRTEYAKMASTAAEHGNLTFLQYLLPILTPAARTRVLITSAYRVSRDTELFMELASLLWEYGSQDRVPPPYRDRLLAVMDHYIYKTELPYLAMREIVSKGWDVLVQLKGKWTEKVLNALPPVDIDMDIYFTEEESEYIRERYRPYIMGMGSRNIAMLIYRYL